MKTIIKKITLMLLSPELVIGMSFAILSVVFFAGCGDDDSTTEESEIYYDTLINGTTVYYTTGVDTTKVGAFIALLNVDLTYCGGPGCLTTWNDPMQSSFTSNVTKIIVRTGSGISYSGTTLKVGEDKDFGSIIMWLINEHIMLIAKIYQKDAIMLANN